MSYRLFFAIWPDADAQHQIQKLFKHYHWPLHAKPVPVVDCHITLSFLGNATEQQYQELLPLMQHLHAASFTLTLDNMIYWSRPDLLLLEPTMVPNALVDLVKGLNSLLQRQQWKLDTREYTPHLTLARRFPDPLGQPAIHLGPMAHPITWHVRELCLADGQQRNQGEAKHYRILQRWGLGQVKAGHLP